ncbi:diguanylate cyclase [Photobacterium damselae]|uniref:diguanylate cyclase n=1 Tax=Photobacterium damselae TaxID=38293 RepID=UPI000B3565F0|nr:diguanylate cyclase [Photobacterium damselae]MDP2516369.1 diguanylate cyclase [Photobacterium damselae subsp. piscicida]MDP2543948.1 diguanylate cyclase [Photobacterium damselae subsp. piscicida]PSV41766.1 hypothetical protein CTT35_18935 [Photobacterium damselae]PSW71705.1 hypothetical protein CTT37_19635 [Photobacterium damselae]
MNFTINKSIGVTTSKPVQDQHGFCHIAGSVSDYPQQSNTIYDLLQQADFAMYEAKQKGKNNIFFATEQNGQTKISRHLTKWSSNCINKRYIN